MRGRNVKKELEQYLKDLHLPSVRNTYEALAEKAAEEGLGYAEYLLELIRNECEERRQRRIERWLRESQLPLEKNLASFEMKRLPKKAVHQAKVLLDGTFLDQKENILAFGNPGSGKTHLLCAIGQELIQRGRRVYFSTCSLLVQELLRGKTELRLDRMLKKLGKYEALILDDIGYVQHNRDEMEVFFTLLAQRYERGSVMITSNLPFSKWEIIFKDPMTTAAAIDRLVHHSVIVELNVPSYRVEAAKKRKQ
jgi:DNA replication protein DnaC